MIKTLNFLTVVMLLGTEVVNSHPLISVVKNGPKAAGALVTTGVFRSTRPAYKPKSPEDLAPKKSNNTENVSQSTKSEKTELNKKNDGNNLGEKSNQENIDNPLSKETGNTDVLPTNVDLAKVRTQDWEKKGAVRTESAKVEEVASEATTVTIKTETYLERVKGYVKSVGNMPRYTADKVRGLFNKKAKSEKETITSEKEATTIKAEENVTADQSVKNITETTVKETLAEHNNSSTNSFFARNKKALLGVSGLGVTGAAGAGLYMFLNQAAEEVHVVPESKTSWFTAKNTVIAAIVAAAGIAAYQMWSMLTKPSFDELVNMYIENTTETNQQIIVEQFCKALQDNGYTSVADQERAIEVLQAKGLIEA